jgi:small subunit ribosomal protein S1
MKALLNDPWASAVELIREGAKVKGKVARIQNFGAFVELLPGVDGLIHISNMASGGRVKDPRDVVKEGDEVEATVISTDWDKRRIGLSLVKTKQELAGELERNQVLEGTVDKIEGFGLFVKLPTGARGLVPAAETGTQRGADLKKEFREGQKVKVAVLETDHKSGKIRLSIRAAVEAEERAEYAGYLNTGSAPSGGSSLGTLGDLFKHKLGQRKSE